ncbi:pullulanase [Bacillus timonensis]|uniref:Pullulanase n=2 Tax=Bacillus timonensis TaxID=1033734 RepID=A0A4V3V768_9BACI|nr:pullulanase [Bacillus timonensis]
MMNITGYSVEKLKDPTGILEGERYEFFLDIEVPEEDELYSENGIELKVIYAVDQKGERIAQYYFYERGTEKVLDFELEEEEERTVNNFCKEHLEDENE